MTELSTEATTMANRQGSARQPAELFTLLCEYLGPRDPDDREPLLVRDIIPDWRVSVNRGRAMVQTSDRVEVPPFHAFIEWHGWPAGFINPFEGSMVAGAEAALITTLTSLIEARKQKEA